MTSISQLPSDCLQTSLDFLAFNEICHAFIATSKFHHKFAKFALNKRTKFFLQMFPPETKLKRYEIIHFMEIGTEIVKQIRNYFDCKKIEVFHIDLRADGFFYIPLGRLFIVKCALETEVIQNVLAISSSVKKIHFDGMSFYLSEPPTFPSLTTLRNVDIIGRDFNAPNVELVRFMEFDDPKELGWYLKPLPKVKTLEFEFVDVAEFCSLKDFISSMPLLECVRICKPVDVYGDVEYKETQDIVDKLLQVRSNFEMKVEFLVQPWSENEGSDYGSDYD